MYFFFFHRRPARHPHIELRSGLWNTISAISIHLGCRSKVRILFGTWNFVRYVELAVERLATDDI